MSCWTSAASVGVHTPPVLPWHCTSRPAAVVHGTRPLQQKLPAPSFSVPVLFWPAGHVPAAVFGVASTPLPTPWQGAAEQQ